MSWRLAYRSAGAAADPGPWPQTCLTASRAHDFGGLAVLACSGLPRHAWRCRHQRMRFTLIEFDRLPDRWHRLDRVENLRRADGGPGSEAEVPQPVSDCASLPGCHDCLCSVGKAEDDRIDAHAPEVRRGGGPAPSVSAGPWVHVSWRLTKQDREPPCEGSWAVRWRFPFGAAQDPSPILRAAPDSEVLMPVGPCQLRLAYSPNSPKSTATHGSSPTTHAS
jgi:hypothetical protein